MNENFDEDFIYVNDKESLNLMCEELKKEKSLGIDLECENNLHHYGSYISLIQISSRKKDWIVDVLVLKNIDPLITILKDDSIQNIFHDVSFDLRILNQEFDFVPKNIFDTQIAALLIGKKDIGLGALLQEYFNIEKECKFQMADWTKRPIKKSMLSYATKDSKYLIELRDLLKKELKELGRLSWVAEEFALIETQNLLQKEMAFDDIKGYHFLSDNERAILKRLFKLRNKLAKKVDRPVHFVMNTKKLKEIISDPPKNIKQWETMTGVHPIVKRHAKEFFEEVEKGKTESITVPLKKKLYYNQDQKERLIVLEDLRAKIADKLHIERHLILNKDQIKDIIVNDNYDNLRNWQKKLIRPN